MKPRPFRYFAIFGAMRTGSNLLERTLNQFDGLNCHGELFNPFFIGKAGTESYLDVSLDLREVDPGALVSGLMQQDDGRLHGFRIFQGHDERIIEAALTDPDCGKVILRRNPLDSYISLKIARETDQWLLGNIKMRKVARVTFDAAEYHEYLNDLDQFHTKLKRTMQSAGQTAFFIDYPDLKSLDVINGLARFLGTDGQLNAIEEPIKRQNPESLEDKVSNYAEMLEALNGNVSGHSPYVGDVGPAGPFLRNMVAKPDGSLIFVPLPGVEIPHLESWVGDGQRFRNQKDLNSFLDDSEDLVSFTVLAHPVQRAYDVFWRRIQMRGPGSYPKVRRRLSRHYGVMSAPEDRQLSVDEYAESFEAFCAFLKANVAGQTGIRIDRDWAPQDVLIEQVTSLLPIRHLLRPEEVEPFCQRILPDQNPCFSLAQNPIPLEQVYSKRVENLIRAAYARDYRKFGFGPWSGSL